MGVRISGATGCNMVGPRASGSASWLFSASHLSATLCKWCNHCITSCSPILSVLHSIKCESSDIHNFHRSGGASPLLATHTERVQQDKQTDRQARWYKILLIDWWIDQLPNQLIVWLIDWLIDWLYTAYSTMNKRGQNMCKNDAKQFLCTSFRA